MFYLLSRITEGIFGKRRQPGPVSGQFPDKSAWNQGKPFTGKLDEDLTLFRQALGESQDIEYRVLKLGAGGAGIKCYLVYVRSLVEGKVVNEDVVWPLISGGGRSGAGDLSPGQDLPRQLSERLFRVADSAVIEDPRQAARLLLRGWVAILIDGSPGCLLGAVEGAPKRAVDIPQVDFTIRGPLDAFNEDLTTNISLIRRRIKDPSLTVHFYEVGHRGRNRVAMLYIEGLARPGVIRQVEEAINRISIDAILDIGQLGELISGRRISPFPLVHRSERPDKASSDLLGGKVVLIVDGSSAAISAPAVLNEFFLAPDDYNVPPISGLFLRLARVFGWMAVMFLPAVYVAVAGYNPGMLRTELAMIIAGTREGVPFSAVMEVLFLETMIEMLEAASIRLPTRLGSTATVVGGLIIGQVAAQARIISTTVLVISAITFISSYTFPSYEITVAWRISKWIVFWSAAFFGVYGLFIGVFILVNYLNSFESFGVPYLRPFAPLVWRDFLSDTLFRAPWWSSWRARADEKRDR